ncbi:MAG: hypothetical protein P4L84_17950, partial [Isosphaeraceae bacterium]|nr:hypothetical protein [Isosphaeraceae bacterium]
NAMTSLAALFDSVKSTIESLRPGVTFVTVVRWWESLSIPGGIGIWPQFTSAFQVIPLFCPSTAGPYLGTNFLHIYAGYYQEDLLSGDPSDLANASITRNFGVPATEFMNPDPSYSGSGAILEMDNEIHEDNVTAAVLADVAGTAYQNSLATVTANAGSFAQFGVVFLSPDLFTGPLGPPTTFPADGFSDQDQYYDQQCHYGSQLFTAAIVSHMEADFAEYGFVNGGGISAVTADGLVQRIAEYFGFDPETGLDLG